MATANLGRVGFVNKGTYSGATAYKVNDVVTYNTGTYACIQANTGQAPTNTSYWQNWVSDDAVHKTGDETIAGVKTFNSAIVSGRGQSIEGTVLLKDRYDAGSLLNIGVIRSTGGVLIGNTISTEENSANIVSTTTLNVAKSAIALEEGMFKIYNAPAATVPVGTAVAITERLRIDTSGNVLITGSGGLGYGTGSGGIVTQLTSKSTDVTLNKPCGQIMMHNASLAAGASVVFGVYNSSLTNKDSIEVTIDGGSITSGNDLYDIRKTISNGYAAITLVNRYHLALAEEVRLNFTVIKGATV